MAIYKLGQENKKETTEDRLQKAINLGRSEALKEVLKWLNEITNDSDDGCGHSMIYFTPFDYKEEMFKSFKERFNIK